MKPTTRLRSFLILASSSLLAVSAAYAQSWSGATNGDWLTTTNWTGGDPAGDPLTTTNTNIAGFSVNANNTISINMTTAGGNYYLGAIDNTGNNTRIIQNTSGTTGVLTLNGATVNSVANTIIRNSTGSLLTIGNSGSGTLGLALGNATTNVIQITSTGGITINSIISGSNGITKQGTGTGVLTLAGNNSYTGTTSINQGVVAISNANALGTTAGGTTIASTGSTTTGGILRISGNITVAENITLTGGSESSGFAAPILNDGGNNTLSGNIILSNLTTGVRISTSSTGGGNLTLSGNISQTGAIQTLSFEAALANSTITVSNAINNSGGDLRIFGVAGTTSFVQLNGVSGSGIGNTTVRQQGNLRLGISDALNTVGSLSLGTTVGSGTFGNGIFDLNGFNQTVGGFVGAPSNTSPTASSNRIVQNSGGTASTLTVGNGVVSGTSTFDGVINGNVALVKTGTGTQILGGTVNSTYTGKTTVQDGTLSFSVGNASATADQQLGKNAALDLGVAATSSGRLLYTGAAGTLAKNINALGNGTDTIENGGSGLLTLSGTLTKLATILTLKGGSNGITVSGVIAGTNGSYNSDLVIDGGITTLTNANTYEGPTFIINGATLNANAANALPTANGRTAVSMDQTGSGSSILAMTVSQSIASLTGATNSTVNLNANTLTIGTTTGSTNFQGAINGSGNLIKGDASTQVLSGTNTYTGTTTVTAGTLAVNGSLVNTTTTVSGGTLQGIGTIGGSVTIQSGGTLAPGNLIESLGLASVDFQAGSTYAYELNSDTLGGDLTYSTGTLDITSGVGPAGSTLTLTELLSGTLAVNAKLTLISYTGGWSSGELFNYLGSTLADDSTFTLGANQWLFNYNDTTGGSNFSSNQNGADRFVTMTVVPEPNVAALLGGLGALMLLRRRR